MRTEHKDAMRTALARSGTAGLSMADYRDHKPDSAPSARTLMRIYDTTWAELCRKAGISTGAAVPGGWTDEAIIKVLRRAAKDMGEPLGITEYGRWRSELPDPLTAPTQGLLSTRPPKGRERQTGRMWEHWCEAAGITPSFKARDVLISDDEMIEVLRAAEKATGSPLTEPAFRAWSAAKTRKSPRAHIPHPRTYTSRWGTWRNAVRAAGLVPTAGPEDKIPADAAMRQAQEWARKVHGVTWLTARTYIDWTREGAEVPVPSLATVVRHYGSWEDALAEVFPYGSN